MAAAHLYDHPDVAEVRQTGMILAIELVKDKAHRSPSPWQERRGASSMFCRGGCYCGHSGMSIEDAMRLMVEGAAESIERATAE